MWPGFCFVFCVYVLYPLDGTSEIESDRSPKSHEKKIENNLTGLEIRKMHLQCEESEIRI